MKNQNLTIYIIGGGASGLMAAIQAARAGARVTVLEQNERPGRKLLATGNGRCNLSSLLLREDAYRGADPEFAGAVLREFSVEDTLNFFRRIGVPLMEKDGWVYPRSGQASTVLNMLWRKAESLGVRFRTSTKAKGICRSGEKFLIQVENFTYEADRVILACGSRASDISGADGSGYRLAQQMGHSLKEPRPALVALRLGETLPWSGVRIQAELQLFIDDAFVCREEGEVQLTDYGISGIPVFQLSRYAVNALAEGKKASLSVDFLPGMSEKAVKKLLEKQSEYCPYLDRRQKLWGLFPDRLAAVLADLPAETASDMARLIRHFNLTVTGSLSEEHAQVMSGGVPTAEMSSETMESRLVPGLFFAGELADIDGRCGGYNLQWAWSSGAVAGQNAASAGGSPGKFSA